MSSSTTSTPPSSCPLLPQGLRGPSSVTGETLNEQHLVHLLSHTHLSESAGDTDGCHQHTSLLIHVFFTADVIHDTVLITRQTAC